MTEQAWRFLPLTDLSYQILLSLSGEPLHGYAILKAVGARTGGRLEPESGTLYTAIRRLGRDGLLEPAAPAADGRRGKTYALTDRGRDVLRAESVRLAGLVAEAREKDLLSGSAGGSDA